MEISDSMQLPLKPVAPLPTTCPSSISHSVVPYQKSSRTQDLGVVEHRHYSVFSACVMDPVG